MSLFQRLAVRGGFAPASATVPVLAPKGRGVAAPIRREPVEQEEELQPARIARMEEEEEQIQTSRISRQEEQEEEEVQTTRINRQTEEEEEPLQAARIRREPEDEEEEVQPDRTARRAEDEEMEEDVQPARVHREMDEEEEAAQPVRRVAEEEEEVQAALLRRQEDEPEDDPIQTWRKQLARAADPDDPQLDPENGPPPDLIQEGDEPNPMMADRVADAPSVAPVADMPMHGAVADISGGDSAFIPHQPGDIPQPTFQVENTGHRGDVVIDQVDVIIHEPAPQQRATTTDTRRTLRARYLGRL